jgi:hypothetical protein
MKIATRTHAVLAIVCCCAGCGSQSTQVAVNSAGNASGNVINTFLSDQPPAVKGKNWMQINYGNSTVYPEAPMLSLYSALKRNPQIERFRVVWDLSILSHSSKRVVTYNRKTKRLWYRWQGRHASHVISEYHVFTSVTPDIIRQATVSSINGGKDNVFTKLPDYGCKRVNLG